MKKLYFFLITSLFLIPFAMADLNDFFWFYNPMENAQVDETICDESESTTQPPDNYNRESINCGFVRGHYLQNVSGVCGQAAKANITCKQATSARIEFHIGNNDTSADNYTLSFWLRLHNTTGGNTPTNGTSERDVYRVFATGTYHNLYLRNDSSLAFFDSVGHCNITNLLSEQWYHIVSVRDGDEQRFFVDGVLNATCGNLHSGWDGAGVITRFLYHLTENFGLDATVDEVASWNYSMSNGDATILNQYIYRPRIGWTTDMRYCNPNFDSALSITFDKISEVNIRDDATLFQEFNGSTNFTLAPYQEDSNDITVSFRMFGTNGSYLHWEVPFATYENTDMYSQLLQNITITVEDGHTHEFWVEVQDEAGTKIPDALVTVMANDFSTTPTTYNYHSREITNDEGRALLYINNSHWYVLSIIKPYYSNQSTVLLNRNKITNNSEDSPFIIKIVRKDTNFDSFGLFLPTRFWLRNVTIRGQLEYRPNEDIRLLTDFMQTQLNTSIALPQETTLFNILGITTSFRALSNLYYLDLEPDIHYNSSGDSNISVLIYLGDSLIHNQSILFLDIDPNRIANLQTELTGTFGYNILLFLVLICLSIIVQLIIKSDAGNIGVHIFLIGAIMISAISYTFWVMSIVALSYYIFKAVKPLVGVAQ